jgi:hypothetical protein
VVAEPRQASFCFSNWNVRDKTMTGARVPHSGQAFQRPSNPTSQVDADA